MAVAPLRRQQNPLCARADVMVSGGGGDGGGAGAFEMKRARHRRRCGDGLLLFFDAGQASGMSSAACENGENRSAVCHRHDAILAWPYGSPLPQNLGPWLFK